MDETLKNVCLLSTRPAGRSDSLRRELAARGGRLCELPLIEIVPLEDPEDTARLKSNIMNLDNYDMAIFVSTNAARLGMQWIDRYWPQLPVGLSAFAVGAGTGEMLKELPWPVYYPETGVTSEDLLALPQMQDVQGRRVALFRGQGGREVLAETLRGRGAQVDYLELYQRRSLGPDKETVMQMIDREGVKVLLVTSAQSLEELLPLLADNEQLARLPLLAPSQRVAERAENGGFRHAVNAGGAGDEAVLSCLLQLFNNP